jgi:hypothetical protein
MRAGGDSFIVTDAQREPSILFIYEPLMLSARNESCLHGRQRCQAFNRFFKIEVSSPRGRVRTDGNVWLRPARAVEEVRGKPSQPEFGTYLTDRSGAERLIL